MSAAKDKNPRLGRHIVKTYGGESVRAFVPPPLPPEPPVRLESIQRLHEQANQSLGRLDGLASVRCRHVDSGYFTASAKSRVRTTASEVTRTDGTWNRTTSWL